MPRIRNASRLDAPSNPEIMSAVSRISQPSTRRRPWAFVAADLDSGNSLVRAVMRAHGTPSPESPGVRCRVQGCWPQSQSRRQTQRPKWNSSCFVSVADRFGFSEAASPDDRGSRTDAGKLVSLDQRTGSSHPGNSTGSRCFGWSSLAILDTVILPRLRGVGLLGRRAPDEGDGCPGAVESG